MIFKYNILYFSILTIVISTIYCNSNRQGFEEESLPKLVTFSEHIAPIIEQNCLPCHRKNGAAPFSLSSYLAVSKRAKTIAKVTAEKIMPPWPADPNYTHFIGEKILTNRQIAMIQKWVKQGASEGTKKYDFHLNQQYRSSIRKPDLVLHFDSVQMHEGDLDRFFISKIHGKIPKTRYVSALEFVPSSSGWVHHANGHLLLYPEGSKKKWTVDHKKFEVTYDEQLYNFPALELECDNGSLPLRIHSAFNYLPGVEGIEYPNGIGTFELTKEFAAVVNDVHYGPSDTNATDKSVLNVFFTDAVPTRKLCEIMLGTNGVSKIVPPLKIAPNTISRHSTRYKITEDISILTINPHLHMLGKSFLAYAIKPNGDTIQLIRIKRWDYNWQYFYTFKSMIKVPAGSEIVALAEFDNTIKNPYNPHRPPQWVSERLDRGGASMRATDEMFQFIITCTGYRSGDEKISLEK